MAVNQPLASPSPPKLTVSYHESNWTPEYNIPPSKVWTLQPGLKHEPSTDIFPTLGNRIIDDEVKWGNDIDFRGEFIYTPGYWEWAEDVLNLFRKPLREGMIYDAVFASLFTYDRNVDIVQAFCEAWCPRTNTLITSSGEMSISLRDLYMLGGLPLLGDIYDERIPNALDLNKSTIRPETFNMTCRMARGIKVCLAPLVLASIYYGLNSILESFSPGQIGTPFPIHYVYGWLAAYFNTHFKTPSLMLLSPKMVTSSGEGGAKHYDKIDARKRIFKGEHASWLCTSRQNGRDILFL
nr:1,2-dihydroxy-3-keto-5-methylthiopentene dioxygenase 4 [Ipomoea batatas]